MLVSSIYDDAKEVLGICDEEVIFKRLTDAVRLLGNSERALGQCFKLLLAPRCSRLTPAGWQDDRDAILSQSGSIIIRP